MAAAQCDGYASSTYPRLIQTKEQVMSAFGIGADTASVSSDGAVTVKQNDPATKSNVPETIVKWIPGEAITFYAAIIGVGTAQGALTGDETPAQLLERIDAGSLPWFLAGVVVAVALMIIGSFASKSTPEGQRPLVKGILLRSVLTVIAFALWTSALPGSWTYSLHIVRDMGPAYAILLVPLGLVFAGVAEMVTRKAAV
jgi:hypothetical protein